MTTKPEPFPVQQDLPKYALTREFEASVVWAETCRPRFHDYIGHALNPEQMPTKEAKLLVMAAHAVAKNSGGVGCTDSMYAVQFLRSLCDKGKLTLDELTDCVDYLEFVDDATSADVEGIMPTLVQIIKRSKQKELVHQAIDDYGKGRELDKTADEFQRVVSLGKTRVSLGQENQAAEADVRATLQTKITNPLGTGIYDLDIMLRGGMDKHSLGVVVGPTGSGKSLFLTSLAVDALISGYDVAYMTLELSEEQVKRRLYCNLCDMSVDELKESPAMAAKRLRAWMDAGMGKFRVVYETGGATTPAHLRTWLRDLEREFDFRPRVVIVDMADHMVSKLATTKNGYEDAKLVYEQLRNIAVDHDGWTWTASHAKAHAEGKKKIRTNMAADSINKMRVCDLQIGLARTEQDEENDTVHFNVGKRREGDDRIELGPISRDAARGRIVMVHERTNPWS